MLNFTKKRAVVAMAVIGSLALSVGAYAYFTSTGNGSGSASVGTAAWTITDAVTTGGPLTPGGATEQSLAYKVTNTSSGNQLLTKVAVTVANADGTPWTPTGGCSKDDFTVNGAAAGATYEDLENAGLTPAGTVRNNTVTIKMIDTGANQDACQGLTPPLYLSAS